MADADEADGGYHFSFKVVICGDSGVGKSTLLDGEGTSAYARASGDNTSGINFRVKFYEVEGKTYRVQFWDCPGAERYLNLTGRFCAGSAGAILVFDVNNRDTFENIERWAQEVDKFGTMIKVLVANKVDQMDGTKREVAKEEIEEVGARLGMDHFETAALSSRNVNEVFQNVFTQIVENLPKPPEPSLLLRKGVKLGGKMLSDPEFRQSLFKRENS
jgi:small GTP-binding protein|eukprot:g3102.t1